MTEGGAVPRREGERGGGGRRFHARDGAATIIPHGLPVWAKPGRVRAVCDARARVTRERIAVSLRRPTVGTPPSPYAGAVLSRVAAALPPTPRAAPSGDTNRQTTSLRCTTTLAVGAGRVGRQAVAGWAFRPNLWRHSAPRAGRCPSVTQPSTSSQMVCTTPLWRWSAAWQPPQGRGGFESWALGSRLVACCRVDTPLSDVSVERGATIPACTVAGNLSSNPTLRCCLPCCLALAARQLNLHPCGW